ncbi:MAG: peptide ABC transporter substrate-binding protein [Dehalococcoidales bacterium]
MLRKILFILISGALLFSLPVGCQLPQVGEITGNVAEGGVLNLYGIDPHTLDPAISGDATSHEYILQIFSGLLKLDDNLEPAPDIAEDWQVSKDGKTYTFNLRQNVIFHDGREVKAEDFKYSWERAANPDTGSQTAASYLGDIVGVKEVLAGESTEISGLRVVNDYTLEVTIDAPKSYFLSKLTYPTAYVVDSNNVEAGTDWWHKPNGTGPFKLEVWNEGNRLVLERNDLYYGSPAGIERVVFHILSGVPMNMYETGEIDVTGVSTFDIDRVTDPAGPFYDELQSNAELSFFYIGFNITKPPFDDARVRRAFSQAVDKEKLASLVFRDMMEPAYGILPPGMPGFNDALSGLNFDVAEAKELIRKSAYGSIDNLPPITITTAGRGGRVSGDLEAIIHQWRENLGVEVKVRQLEPERFFYNLKEEKDEMFDMGWIADYPHPQDFLEILFSTGTENNYGEYSNPEVDALLKRAGVELDTELSLELYREAEQILVDDAAMLPLWFGRNFVLVKPHIRGYDLNPMGLVDLSGVTIER